MILFALPPHTTETVPAWNHASLRSWRWAAVADRWSVGAEEQMQRGEAGLWYPALRYVYVGAARTPPDKSGYYHDYYDGCHRTLWLGPFFLSWSLGWRCDICMPPEKKDTSGTIAGFVEALLGAAMEVQS